ncbi:Histidine kinase-like ATPase [Flammeovirgaceae bacterium 311]|nr:Histidine kinase-like ATPase [Flammeovirgaceae bacterium 311]
MRSFNLFTYTRTFAWALLAWLAAVGVGCPVNLYAQDNEIKFKSLTSREGLSSSLVWSMAQDQHGFIWIGTNDGLNVYNGYEFKTYRHLETDTTSITHNYTSSLLYDSNNRLWVGTPHGLDLYNAEKDNFTHYKPGSKTDNRHNNILWVYEDRQQNIWTGTNSGMSFYDEATKKFETSPMPASMGITTQVTALLQDKKGRYWLGTEEGLYAYSPQQKSFTVYRSNKSDPASIATDHIYTLYEDSRGDIWVGTSEGLSLYKPEEKGFTHFRLEHPYYYTKNFSAVRCMVEGRDGNLWVGTYEGGVKKFNVTSQTFTTYLNDPRDPYSLVDNAVKDILIDQTGGLWISTFRGIGFADHYQLQFDHLEHHEYDPNSLTDNYITSLFKDSKDNLWSGNRNGISRFDPNTQKFTHYKHDPADQSSIADGAVIHMSEDTEGNLWSITHIGIVNSFDPGTKTFRRYEADPGDSSSIQEHSNFVLCTQDGGVWVSFRQGISLKDKDGKGFTHFYLPDSISLGGIKFMFEDSRENLLAVGGGTIYKFDRSSGAFSFYQAIPDSLIPFQTTDILEDRNNNLWIGSAYSGLIFYNPDKDSLRLYTNKGDLPDLYIKGILEDRLGNLWLSTNNSLCKFNPTSGQYTIYDQADGLKNSEFNMWDCVRAADGRMYFGGNYGISAFYPGQILKNPNKPKVVVTNFQLFNKAVPIGENSPLKKSITETSYLELDYKQSVLSFEFVALNFNSPEKNQYAYRMLGFDNDWNYSGTRRYATYTNLPPGKTYIFQVKASNNAGVWNEEGTSIQIYIQPPFWITWWFYTLLASFIIACLWLFYHWRSRQHYLQRRELEVKVKERTEEVEAQKEVLEAHANHLKSANQEIKRKNKKIIRQSNKLKALDQLKSQFLQNISHEFRTPLTLILVPLEEMLSASQSNADTKGQLSVMNRNARRLLQLINQLLDLSKLENGSVPMELSPKNIIQFIKSAALSFESLAKKHRIDYSFFCHEAEIITPFDADKLEKIMYNLISNAFKFTPEGGSIKVGVKSLELTESGDSNRQVKQQQYVQITVSDTGAGISAEHLPYIFDRFYQAEPSLVRKSDGTGIGLALTRELVKLHGGKIKVSSEPGQGTCFTVLLPLMEQTVEQSTPADITAPEVTLAALGEESADYSNDTPAVLPNKAAPLLLIVEDNPDLRQQIKRIFSADFKVEEASDGTEGWQKAVECMPDFIISDVMMPGKDGLALCNQLKNSPDTSHIPTILLSARIDGEEAGLRIGADDYITKPFNAKTLVLKVKNLLKTRQKFREALCRELGVQPLATAPETAAINPQDKQFLEQASEIALNHLTDADFDMELFYRELGMSRTLVYKKLKSLTGLGPNEFIRRIRLNKASSLLLKGKYSISEVMFETGFNHRSYFIKCFRGEFGHLPSEHASSQKALPALQQE